MTMGDKPAYSVWPHSVSPLRRLAGGRAPSDPRHNPAPAAFAVGVRRSPRSARRRMFSRRRPITAGRCPSASRLSPRSDRRATWSALPPLRRRSPRLRHGLRPFLLPGSNLLPTPDGRGRERIPSKRPGRRDGLRPPRRRGGPAGAEPGAGRGGRCAGLVPRARWSCGSCVRPGACGGQTHAGRPPRGARKCRSGGPGASPGQRLT